MPAEQVAPAIASGRPLERVVAWGSIGLAALALLGVAASAGAANQRLQDHAQRIAHVEAGLRSIDEKLDRVRGDVTTTKLYAQRLCVEILDATRCRE